MEARSHDFIEEQEPDNNESQNSATDQSDFYACHICLETASEPVVTLCGHLFCWPCIYRWLETPGGNACPVCKAGLGKDKLIPIYGRGSDNKDPRETTPARPAGQRTEQRPSYHNHWQGFGPEIHTWQTHFTFGPGGFSTFNFPDNSPQAPRDERQMFARLLFSLGVLLLFSILMI